MSDGATLWFEDRAIVRQFPLRFRLLALYCRLMRSPATGVVRGGSFLHRMLARATRLLRLPDTVSVRIGGAVIYLDLLDSRIWWVLDEVRGGGAEHEVMRRCIAAGDTFVDVGANHGGYAVFAAALTGAGGRVVACEPQPRLARLVEQSLAATGASPYEVLAAACGDREEMVDLFIPRAGSGSASVFADYQSGPNARVEVRQARLDDAVDWQSFPGRVFVKLDVEGSELAFLRGAEELIRARQPLILLEINDESARAGGYGVNDVLQRLAELGYDRAVELGSISHAVPLVGIDHAPLRNVVAVHGHTGSGRRE